MSDKIQDKFAVLLAGFRTSEGAPRLVIPEAGADAAAMLKSKAGAAAVEARIDALGAERKALKRLGKFMRKHGAALDVAAPGVADGAAPARKARRPRAAAKGPAAAKTEPAAATSAAKPAGRKPGRPRGSGAAKPVPSAAAAEPAVAAKAPARRPYTRKAVAAKVSSANVAPAKAAAVAETAAPAAKPARSPRARKVAPAAAAAAPSASTARRTGTAPGRRSGRKATPTT